MPALQHAIPAAIRTRHCRSEPVLLDAVRQQTIVAARQAFFQISVYINMRYSAKAMRFLGLASAWPCEFLCRRR